MPPIAILSRMQFRPDGIFGKLTVQTDDESTQFDTLEHAYLGADGWAPKVPEGSYTCRRGPHVLPGGEHVDSFEVMDVPGHTGILFHCGNYNSDSDGCILIGSDGLAGFSGDGRRMILRSRIAFADFMELLAGVTDFQLTVERA